MVTPLEETVRASNPHLKREWIPFLGCGYAYAHHRQGLETALSRERAAFDAVPLPLSYGPLLPVPSAYVPWQILSSTAFVAGVIELVRAVV